MELSQEVVKELFDYHEDGYLTWKTKRNGINKNMAVGYVDKTTGYLRAKINGSSYRIHRIVFLWHHGFLPDVIDHKDNNPLNNKIENLRPANASQNNWNSVARVTNTSGFKGVSWHKQKLKWCASIGLANAKKKWLGAYKTPEEAHEAYKQAAIKHFGEFARY